jgi:hypothetical protein
LSIACLGIRRAIASAAGVPVLSFFSDPEAIGLGRAVDSLFGAVRTGEHLTFNASSAIYFVFGGINGVAALLSKGKCSLLLLSDVLVNLRKLMQMREEACRIKKILTVCYKLYDFTM